MPVPMILGNTELGMLGEMLAVSGQNPVVFTYREIMIQPKDG